MTRIGSKPIIDIGTGVVELDDIPVAAGKVTAEPHLIAGEAGKGGSHVGDLDE